MKSQQDFTKKRLEALEFIKDNKYFFAAPFMNQEQFASWMTREENKVQGDQLSKKLRLIATGPHNNPLLGELNQALIGSDLQLDPCLLTGDDTEIINFFDKAPNFCVGILGIKKDPIYMNLITKWNEEHQEEIQNQDEGLKAFNEGFGPVWQRLRDIESKANTLNLNHITYFQKEDRAIKKELISIKKDLKKWSNCFLKTKLDLTSKSINDKIKFLEDKIEPNLALPALTLLHKDISNIAHDLSSKGYDQDAKSMQESINIINKSLNKLTNTNNTDDNINVETENIRLELVNLGQIAKKHRSLLETVFQELILIVAAFIDVITLTATQHIITNESLIIGDSENAIIDFYKTFVNFKEQMTQLKESENPNQISDEGSNQKYPPQ